MFIKLGATFLFGFPGLKQCADNLEVPAVTVERFEERHEVRAELSWNPARSATLISIWIGSGVSDCESELSLSEDRG